MGRIWRRGEHMHALGLLGFERLKQALQGAVVSTGMRSACSGSSASSRLSWRCASARARKIAAAASAGTPIHNFLAGSAAGAGAAPGTAPRPISIAPPRWPKSISSVVARVAEEASS